MEVKMTREFSSKTQAPVDPADMEQVVWKALGTNARLSSVEISKNGDVNSCYVLHTINPTGKFFLKVENQDLLPKFYSGQIEREVAGMALLNKAGLPCPNVVGCDITGQEIGKKYMLTDFIEGRMLSDVWANLTPSGKAAAKKQVCEMTKTINSIHNPVFGDLYPKGNRGAFPTWSGAYERVSSILLQDCIDAGLLGTEEEHLVQETVRKSSSMLTKAYVPCLNHMDIHWQNLLVDIRDDRVEIKALLDFGNAMFGFPFTDQYRLYGFLFFTEAFYDADNPVGYSWDTHEKLCCELLYALEFLVFEGMIGADMGSRQKILDLCNTYLHI